MFAIILRCRFAGLSDEPFDDGAKKYWNNNLLKSIGCVKILWELVGWKGIFSVPSVPPPCSPW